ncbi:hypothetical protein BROUX41_004337 [Berkeleyomyces rouxiae]|uniref:uncharacterized protein n=1 Tax=Berkeleyomyces rouxiae TaxID=2035830 RepID=UPI003B7A4542
MASSPKFTLYTNRGCPWCRRVHAALNELGTEVEEVTIDLSKPRPDWYLKINPKGQVPTLVYDDKVVSESDVITRFFADREPSHLVKIPGEEGAEAQRAQYDAFVNQFLELAQKPVMGTIFAGIEMTSERADEVLDKIATTLEPQLASAKPFFGGSDKLTLVEVLTGPFLSMLFDLAIPEFKFPANWNSLVESKTPVFYKWAKATANHDSISFTWNKEVATNAIRGIAAARATK